MNSRRVILLLALATLFLVGCGNRASGLPGTCWRWVEIDGRAPLIDAEATLAFDAKSVTGSTGCNRYFGEYTASRGALAFGVLGQTEMACLEPKGIMAQERAYLDALARAEQFTVVDNQLTIRCEGGQVLVFSAADE